MISSVPFRHSIARADNALQPIIGQRRREDHNGTPYYLGQSPVKLPYMLYSATTARPLGTTVGYRGWGPRYCALTIQTSSLIGPSFTD